MGIRFLAGGSYDDIRLVCGVSKSSFFRSVYKFLDALEECPELRIKFPLTAEEKRATAQEFMRISSHEIHRGVISCIDGWLCEIQAPKSSETDNVAKFFSGHYQTFGINVQAGCDANCVFNYVSITCPGGTNDCVAYEESSLFNHMNQQDDGYYLLGDNAYPVSEKILTPFCKTDGITVPRDAYNFYLSQLRIRIEMSFGLLVGKWRIFKKPLEVSLKNCKKVIAGAMILHNFCLKESLRKSRNATFAAALDPEFEYDCNILSSAPTDVFKGVSVLRNIIVDRIQALNVRRPARNIARNGANV
jgi:hypothetical protein